MRTELAIPRVSDIMSRDVLTVAHNMRLDEVAMLLVGKSISGVPVTDDNGDVIGVLSLTDLAVVTAGAQAEVRPTARRPDFYRDLWNEEELQDGFTIEDRAPSLRASDIMTPVVYVIPEN